MVPQFPTGFHVSRRYSGSSTKNRFSTYGALTLCGWPSHTIQLTYSSPCASPQPQRINPLVCPLPRSLATTSGISVDFSSSPYLDVSVQAVPHLRLFYSTHADRVLLCRVSPFGNLRDQSLCAAPPRLIAACHVLHRLLMPRHSPCALSSLTFVELFRCSLSLVLKNYAGCQIWFIVVCVTLF